MKFSTTILALACMASASVAFAGTVKPVSGNNVDTFGSITLFADGRVGNIPQSPANKVFLRGAGGKLLKTVAVKCGFHDSASMNNDVMRPALESLQGYVAQSNGALRELFLVCNTVNGDEIPFPKEIEHFSGGSQTRDYMTVSPENRNDTNAGGFDYFLWAPAKTLFAVVIGNEKLLSQKQSGSAKSSVPVERASKSQQLNGDAAIKLAEKFMEGAYADICKQRGTAPQQIDPSHKEGLHVLGYGCKNNDGNSFLIVLKQPNKAPFVGFTITEDLAGALSKSELEGLAVKYLAKLDAAGCKVTPGSWPANITCSGDPLTIAPRVLPAN